MVESEKPYEQLKLEDLLDLLYDLEDFLDNQADADLVDERYVPNTAMQLQSRVQETLARWRI